MGLRAWLANPSLPDVSGHVVRGWVESRLKLKLVGAIAVRTQVGLVSWLEATQNLGGWSFW